MKQFRKNSEGHFICEECGKTYNTKRGLGLHIKHKHYNDKKEYFDKWIKDQNDGICITCGEETPFNHQWNRYEKNCSRDCIKKYNYNQTKDGNLKKYGVKNQFQRKEITSKIKEIKIEKYGIPHSIHKTRETLLKRYGVDNPSKLEWVKQKISVSNKKCSLEALQKRKNSVHNKYGVENIMQNKSIFEKSQKTRFLRKKFKDTDVFYQGSYELDFLEKFYDKIDIENGPSIPYLFEGNLHVYHSDFYIPSLNLVVEIKNSYLFKRDYNKINEKEKAVISNSFNYCIIINKDYAEFNSSYRT
jgi:hypothetical protein